MPAIVSARLLATAASSSSSSSSSGLGNRSWSMLLLVSLCVSVLLSLSADSVAGEELYSAMKTRSEHPVVKLKDLDEYIRQFNRPRYGKRALPMRPAPAAAVPADDRKSLSSKSVFELAEWISSHPRSLPSWNVQDSVI